MKLRILNGIAKKNYRTTSLHDVVLGDLRLLWLLGDDPLRAEYVVPFRVLVRVLHLVADASVYSGTSV